MEVILALAILTGAMAVLGELARLGLRNASYARQMTQAELLCESKMAQITSGMVTPDADAGVPFSPEDLIDPTDPVSWVYTIEVGDVEQETGLRAVTVTVAQDLPEGYHPVRFSLVHWVVDPNIEQTGVAAGSGQQTAGSTKSTKEASTSQGSGSSSGSSSGGSSTGGRTTTSGAGSTSGNNSNNNNRRRTTSSGGSRG